MFEEVKNYFVGLSHGISFIQIIDLLLVIVLVYQLYRTLKGSIAFNIFLGVLAVYIIFIIVRYFKMPLLSEIISQFIPIALISIIIVFQPEIRRFLTMIGRNTPFMNDNLLTRLFKNNSLKRYVVEEDAIDRITKAISYFLTNKLGALLVIARSENVSMDTNTGVAINGFVTSKLLECIFLKDSPLHDGAVVIDKNIIVAARVVLPLSEDSTLPSRVGLRHRAAVGASEHSDVLVIVVSEEKNIISYALNGKLHQDVSIEEIKKQLFDAMLK